MSDAHNVLNEYDKKFAEKGDKKLLLEANEKIAKLYQDATQDTLNKVLFEASKHMKNGYSRSDN